MNRVLARSLYRRGLGGFALPAYRFYQLDGAGKITTADWLAADSDEEAIAHVRKRAGSSRFELWERNRLVCRDVSERS